MAKFTDGNILDRLDDLESPPIVKIYTKIIRRKYKRRYPYAYPKYLVPVSARYNKLARARFTALPVASADAGPCAYISGYALTPLGGNRYYCYAANALGDCCSDQLWAALWVELWVDGVHIPPIDVQSPFSTTVQTATGAITFNAWVTWACPASCPCPYC